MKEVGIGSILKCFCIAGLFFFALCAVVLFVATLRTHWIAESNQHEKDVNLVTLTCGDTDQVRKTGMETLCNEKLENVEILPSESALYRTFEDWSLCGKGGCAAVFGKLRRPLELFLLVALLIVGVIGMALVMSIGRSRSSLVIPDFVQQGASRDAFTARDVYGGPRTSWKPKVFEGSTVANFPGLQGMQGLLGLRRDAKKTV